NAGNGERRGLQRLGSLYQRKLFRMLHLKDADVGFLFHFCLWRSPVARPGFSAAAPRTHRTARGKRKHTSAALCPALSVPFLDWRVARGIFPKLSRGRIWAVKSKGPATSNCSIGVLSFSKV